MRNKALKLWVISLMTILASCGGQGGGELSTPTVGGSEGSEPPLEKTQITFFGWGSSEEIENFETLVDEFEKDNTDIEVIYSNSPSDSYMTNLKNKGNSLPDVFYMPDYEFMQWADSGKLLAIDSYMTNEELDSMWDLSTDMYRYDSSTTALGEGNLYGLPKDLGPYPLVYNKTLLQRIISENNLDLELPDPTIPMTWNEFVDYLKKITVSVDGKDVYGIGYYELMAAVYSNNADFFDETVTTQTINSKNFVDAVQFIADLTLKHKVAPTADEQSSSNSFQRFMNQGCVFTFMGPWDCKQFWEDLKFEFDVVPVPVGPAEGAKSTAWVGSVAYCVSATSRKKDAAVRLAKYLACSEKSNIMNYQLGQAIPNIKSIAEGDYLDGVGLEGRQLMPANRKLFVDIVKGTEYVQGHNRSRYYTYDNTCLDDLDSSLSPVYLGQKTAEQFLNEHASKFQASLDLSNEF